MPASIPLDAIPGGARAGVRDDPEVDHPDVGGNSERLPGAFSMGQDDGKEDGRDVCLPVGYELPAFVFSALGRPGD